MGCSGHHHLGNADRRKSGRLPDHLRLLRVRARDRLDGQSSRLGLRLLPLGPLAPRLGDGPAFISANLGAVEIMGMSASGAQAGLLTVHYFWVGRSRRCCSSAS